VGGDGEGLDVKFRAKLTRDDVGEVRPSPQRTSKNEPQHINFGDGQLSAWKTGHQDLCVGRAMEEGEGREGEEEESQNSP
jgi:hypothetical protein